jgi:hypothetical protein
MRNSRQFGKLLKLTLIELFKEMFDLALKCGAQLHIQNRQHLTALTLSAYLAKKEV